MKSNQIITDCLWGRRKKKWKSAEFSFNFYIRATEKLFVLLASINVLLIRGMSEKNIRLSAAAAPLGHQ